MPLTLVDRLPLPNLKVYTAGSVLLLSAAVYHALEATRAPGWRVNATLQRQGAMEAPPDALNTTRNLTEHLADVVTYMMQEPLCMWTAINMAYCSVALVGLALQRAVFGRLRVAEAQRVKDKFWNYVFYKFIFVFGVVNVQYMDEVLLWCWWFTLLGFLHLLGQLCKDRFEYLASSPVAARWAHARLAWLTGGIVLSACALLGAAAAWGLPAGRDTFAFMAAECLLVLLSALHVAARYALRLCEADAAGPRAYYTHLVFESCTLVVELVHVVHMVVYSNLLVSMPSLVLLMQLRHLLHELQARLRRHRLYTSLTTHMSQNYPMASKEEVDKNQDNCAICWEPMKEARKLPCAHLFHNSCLCQWVQQDASCPTCRRALHASPPAHRAPPPAASALQATPAPPHTPAHAHHPNHLFHFDGSRYVSWLPSFSVEVTRVRAPPPPIAQLEAMAAQVQQMFPHYTISALVADLSATRSPDLTVENILEGRLLPPASPAPAPSPSSVPAPSISAPETLRRRVPEPAEVAHVATSTSGMELRELYIDHESASPAHGSARFSRSASERESTLQQRKELLVAHARRKYLERAEHPSGPRPRLPPPPPHS